MTNDRRAHNERRSNWAPATTLRPHDVLHALVAHPLRWAGPLVVCTILAVLYALFKPATWEATQALLVRDEAAGKSTRPVRYGAIEEMKTAQETVLELIKSRGVLAGTLQQVGPPAGEQTPQGWPSDRTIESLSDAIKIVPPKGAEFGKTEVFYLKVQSGDPARAIALTKAVCQRLEAQFDDLRSQKYQGAIEELTKTVSLAEADLNASTEQLSAVERAAGPDLAELRILNESPSNESGLRRVAGEIETELRTYRASVASNLELLKLLQASLDDPGRLLASPGRLLDSQPALKRLKDGLVDAELRTAQLLGNMAESHPAVVAAKASEQEISDHLHQEISIGIKGLELDLRLANERVSRLEEQRKDVQDRLVHLASIRAQYSNLAATVRNRVETLKNAQQELAEARRAQAAAHAASLITLVGQPNVGSRPAGPGKTMIVLAGMFGGLAIGAGIVFLTIQPLATPGSRPTGVPAPREGGSTSQRAGDRSGDDWTADRHVERDASPTPREKSITPSTTSPRVTASNSRSPVAAGSLSLRQALDRVFPGSPSNA